MAVTAPLHESPSAQSAFDESAMREPVEALFREARRRARRRRLIIGAVLAACTIFATIAVTSSIDGTDRPPDQEAALGAPVGATPLGIFEPLRGRIVYVAGWELRGIDPADPSSVRTVELPDDPQVDRPPGPWVASGWSSDGTKLALTAEFSGDSWVVDAGGGITRVPSAMGCCMFVSDAWLSPDGTSALEWVTADRLHVFDIGRSDTSRVIDLVPPVDDVSHEVLPVHAWSPDGNRLAYVADRQAGPDLVPSVYTADLDTGATRELVGAGFGHIRHMTWSPDGSRLLVIAGPWRATIPLPGRNPLTLPQPTGLYLIDVDPAAPAATPSTLEPIVSGHFIAATWSPDGDGIAAIDFSDSGRPLVAMRADGSESRILVRLWPSHLFSGLAWHPGTGQ